jgi:hypothetical protein
MNKLIRFRIEPIETVPSANPEDTGAVFKDDETRLLLKL